MASTGIPGLITPYSTSEFQAMVEKVREHHWATAGQMHEIAAELRHELRKHLRDQAGGRAEAMMIARAVTRPLIVATRFDYDVARLALRSYNIYLDRVVNRGKAPRSHGRNFDPNK